jgi:Methyltransferase domain
MLQSSHVHLCLLVACLPYVQDWIRDDLDVRQLLIETHRIPVKIGLQPSTFFDGIERAGFALFSKEPNIHPDAGGKSIEWSYVKLRSDFFPPPPVKASA